MKPSNPVWVYVTWLSAVFIAVATVSLLSPSIAATSIIPWLLFFAANVTWVVDMLSVHVKSWPWIALGTFCMLWDVLIVFSRLQDFPVLEEHLSPFLSILERLFL